MKRVLWRALVLSVLATMLPACSDDESPTETPIPDPTSGILQVNAIPGGTIFACGNEGQEGRLYSNLAGSWGDFAVQTEGEVPNPPAGPTGFLPRGATDLYVYSPASGVHHLEEQAWVAQTCDVRPENGALEEIHSVLWLRGRGGLLLRHDTGSWTTVLDTGNPDAEISGVTAIPGTGTTFAAEFDSTETSRGRVYQLGQAGPDILHELTASVYAVAAEGDSVWAAGRKLFCLADATWDTLCAIPDGNLVHRIGRSARGVMTLICSNGVIYRWQGEELATVQAIPLSGELYSVLYLADDEIYGSLNIVDQNTGHDIGIIVRYDGMNWVTDFLAPPS